MSNLGKVKQPEGRVQPVVFPWLSTLVGLLLVTYLLFHTEPELLLYYAVPSGSLRAEVKYALLGVFVLVLLVDLRRYRQQSARQKADLKALREQMRELWLSKKQLQLKAHTYSGHADKLKMFISDKLLEYIEYDEKFLHFKSIAAEVRHNGVISFDKVQTALQNAGPEAHSALGAMRYLWDLLDLSTADNLALHISGHLAECEEQYYQRMLNPEDTPPLPHEPFFTPQRAAWRALSLVRADTPEVSAEWAEQQAWHLADTQWHVQLRQTGALLGNENHLILLLENLLKNAQFFSGKRGYKSPWASISFLLDEVDGQVRLHLYNRGPHIKEEDRSNLFQLGFSTRRVREHHGRGLGLYFVQQIVKGYEGRINVENVVAPETTYNVRIELDNDEVLTDTVQVKVVNGIPRCVDAHGAWLDEQTWEYRKPVKSVEITEQNDTNPQRKDDWAIKGKQAWFDGAHAVHPHWQLILQPKRGAHQLLFMPLDIRGVLFDVRLPTAEHRLESAGLPQEDMDAEVERLDEEFRTRVPFNQ
ncbi:ATP-binding protein [Salinispirillum marinum]|uniref:histidine kinase n=2 Tax=Saccharospirillaceae TaxID=255527 RepID=A0ABV8BD43_9GAMM